MGSVSSTNSAHESSPPAAGGRKAKTPFIVGAFYDNVWFIWAPMAALIVSIVIAFIPWWHQQDEWLDSGMTRVALLVTATTYGHLCAVFFRSHGNSSVFAQHRHRFISVPLVLVALCMASDWALETAVIAALSWDVDHTSMQNFGFCRIYDSKAGNDPTAGRRLDLWMNHLLYIGPIIVGPNFAQTIGVITNYSRLGWDQPSQLFQLIGTVHAELIVMVLVSGAAFIPYYIYRYWRMAKQGHVISRQKVYLLISTGIASITAWCLLPVGHAFVTANLFHAVQYFAIVWCMEKVNITRLFRIPESRNSGRQAFVLYAIVLGGAGIAYKFAAGVRLLMAVTTVISLMHFWYDGFIWSVRKREIP